MRRLLQSHGPAVTRDCWRKSANVSWTYRNFCAFPPAIAMRFLLLRRVDRVEEQAEGGVCLAAMLWPEREHHRSPLA